MTKEQAIALYESGFWEDMTLSARAEFQLYEDRLCMPSNVFREAVEKTLGRPVYTHEFGRGRDSLKAELRGDGPPPTMQQIMDLLPQDRQILVLGP